jgi:hypothetical protein
MRYLPRLLFGPGRRVRRAGEQRHDTFLKLFAGHRRRIVVENLEPRRKHVPQRSKGQRRHFGRRLAVEEPEMGRRKQFGPVLKLLQQARFADAGFAQDRHRV